METRTIRITEEDFERFQEIRNNDEYMWLSFRKLLDDNIKADERLDEIRERIQRLEEQV